MQNESEIINHRDILHNFERYSDIISINDHPSFGAPPPTSEGYWNFQLSENISQQKIQQFFQLLFSPKYMKESLIRHNQILEMKCFEDSESQPEQLFTRRAKRVKKLQENESKKHNILQDIKIKDTQKYKALCEFIKLFGTLKQKIGEIRHDYYSEKTFLALEKLTFKEMQQVTKVLFEMFTQIMKQSCPQNIQEKYLQFLTVPRFFISKQKFIKLINNHQTQQSFKTLILNGCLGHYNNEANKKLPQQNYMKYVRQLLDFPDGKERYRKICSINHGGKFYKRLNDHYYSLYYLSFQRLKKISELCKKKYLNQQIIAEIQKVDSTSEDNDERSSFRPTSVNKFPRILENNDFHENEKMGASNFYQIKSVSSIPNFLNSPQDQNDVKLYKANSLFIQTTIHHSVSKSKIKRVHSLVPVQETKNSSLQQKFRLKKSYTLQTTREIEESQNLFAFRPPIISGLLDVEDFENV